jgi:hypothetical protein
MKHQPIRLCGACYAQVPCHRIEWQFKTTVNAIATSCTYTQNVQTVRQSSRFRLYGWMDIANGVL